AIATIGVKKIETASKFYEDILGLKPAGPQRPGTRAYQSGSARLFVYASQYAGTNQATAVTWVVGDVEKLVRELAAKGVKFEHYDLPETTRKGDLHIAGGLTLAWFKDPDGNIHALVSQ
ncbi:MAG TPA: VOC family protein, partial [Candidatus Angelobacter sp.]|nr:VOC family protein [Candidatus Angelobacter sp.]